MNNPISAFIIVKNGEKLIGHTIKSIQNVVDEIIVVDSGSTDNTVQVAKDLGANVVFNEWPGYTRQKIFGESLCKHQWILNLDADEALSPELQDEINYIFQSASQDKYKGYRMHVTILIPNDNKPRFVAPSTLCTRLYNRSYISFANTEDPNTTHDSALLLPGLKEKDNLLTLVSPVYHRSFTSISGLLTKINFYTDESAKTLAEQGRKVSKLRLYTEFFICFFKYFFIRRYWVFGTYGVIYSYMFAFSRFVRLAKVYELQNSK